VVVVARGKDQDGWAAIKPPDLADIAFARIAVTKSNTWQGNPVMSKVAQNAGQRWYVNKWSDHENYHHSGQQ
jgi:hypothetical protein